MQISLIKVVAKTHTVLIYILPDSSLTWGRTGFDGDSWSQGCRSRLVDGLVKIDHKIIANDNYDYAMAA